MSVDILKIQLSGNIGKFNTFIIRGWEIYDEKGAKYTKRLKSDNEIFVYNGGTEIWTCRLQNSLVAFFENRTRLKTVILHGSLERTWGFRGSNKIVNFLQLDLSNQIIKSPNETNMIGLIFENNYQIGQADEVKICDVFGHKIISFEPIAQTGTMYQI